MRHFSAFRSRARETLSPLAVATLLLAIWICGNFVARVYALDAFSPSIPSGFALVSFSASGCPPGFTEDTAAQGFYMLGRAATGTVGNSIGSAISGTAPADASYTPSGTNNACPTQIAVTTAGTINVCSPAFTPTFTGAVNSTMRSAIAPAKYVLVCKKL